MCTMPCISYFMTPSKSKFSGRLIFVYIEMFFFKRGVALKKDYIELGVIHISADAWYGGGKFFQHHTCSVS